MTAGNKITVDWKTSGWLTATPMACQHFNLSPEEFRDTLSSSTLMAYGI